MLDGLAGPRVRVAILDDMRATVTKNGDLHLPDEVREQLRLRPGDQVELRLVSDHSAMIETRTVDPMSLAGALKCDRAITLEDMERAIEEGATGR